MASNLPPGCSNADIERYFACGPCDICGGNPESDCICPECPVCSAAGDRICYISHGMIRTKEQAEKRAKYEQRLFSDRDEY